MASEDWVLIREKIDSAFYELDLLCSPGYLTENWGFQLLACHESLKDAKLHIEEAIFMYMREKINDKNFNNKDRD